MIDQYDWAGGREAMIRFGPTGGPVAIVALPPFEEANRTRTFVTTMLRALANQGIASVVPDLPGTGESLVATQDARLADWKAAFAAAAGQSGAGFGIAIRSGALIDGAASLAARWRLAPQTGAMLVRELERIRQAAARENAEAADDEPIIEIAGNRVARSLLDDLAAASPTDTDIIRTVRLRGDAQPADLLVDSAPIWRRAEPGNDPELARTLADDVAAWVRTCGE